MTEHARKPTYRRTQYFVAKRFQLKYVGLILALMFLTAMLCSYVVYYTSMLNMGEKLANVYPQGRLVSIVKIVNFRIFVSLLFITPLVVMIGIFLSHRIAGPIFRMEKFLQNLAAGDLTARLTLREKDELIALANGINAVVDSLRESVGKEKDLVAGLATSVADLEKAIEAKQLDQAHVRSIVSRLTAELNSLKKARDRYKL